ncbi:GumN family protein [Lysobacter dokdonensis DS-58]|uniref:GumN family protein n=1 Tax=Lysobacter dokdonensis DS-58 TaxID=1300345 RepID=A0A0A2WJI3_9GAMM|nr:TraB/GumN family protein [Lysobacter dokdonensis]KGQ19973.1 GumN family protein [Lysobacter dokdonensis DS-58]
MRRITLLASVLALIAAVPSLAADSAEPAKSAAPVPLLWKVSDKDNSVYLLGSFHMLRESDYPLSKDVDDALADAEEVIFEMSPEEMTSPDIGRKMVQAGQRTDGTSLDSDLTPALRARLDAWLRTSGLRKTQFDTMKPWFASLFITIMEARKAGFNSEIGLDNHLGKAATQQGKRTGGLESGMQQIAFFESMTSHEQLQMLAESLDEDDNGSAAIERMHAQWRAGDVDALWKTLGVEFRDEYPALYKRINKDRNDAWVPKLVQRLEKKGSTDDTLAVVGSLHLLGKDGVVAQLKQRGYTVERVCSACAKR